MQQHSADYFLQEYEKLNAGQRKAVDTIDGPLLVIAGPGTGKTQILSARIANILRNTDTGADQILCLTYTDAGAIAMRQRLLRFIGPQAYNIQIYTFHAFCNRVIQDNPDVFKSRELNNMSDLERVTIIHHLIDALPHDHLLRSNHAEEYRYVHRNAIIDVFSLMKKENMSSEYISQKIDEYIESLPDREEYQYKRAGTTKTGIKYQKGDVKEHAVLEKSKSLNKLRSIAVLFEMYEASKARLKLYEFDDMIQWVLHAFRTNEDVLRTYQEQFLYILVDEYQDTNSSQNEIVDLLSSYWESPDLFVVGDDDQSIFRFQGASVDNIVEFYTKHIHNRNDRSVVLDQNYRSSQHILDASQALVSNNTMRLTSIIPNLNKSLTAAGPLAQHPSIPHITEYPNLAQEETAIALSIQELKDQGVPLSEIAVIYPKHKVAENILRALQQNNIPVQVKKKVNILELPLIRGLLLLLKYIEKTYTSPYGEEHLLFDILHHPWNKISRRDISRIALTCFQERKMHVREYMAQEMNMLKEGIVDIGSIKQLEQNLTFWTENKATLTLQVLFERIITRGKVLEWIMQQPDKTWQLQVLTTIFDYIKEESAKDYTFDLPKLLAQLDNMSKAGLSIDVQQVMTNEEGVNFITAHSSKGLEFDYVFMMGCTKDNWDKKRGGSITYPDNLVTETSTIWADVTEDKKEEEEMRRLFFVAMTRARKELFISYADSKNTGAKLECSRYVAELISNGLLPEKKTVSNEAMASFNLLMYENQEVYSSHFIDHELVDQVLKTAKISATALDKYLRCPIAYYFENIIRVPQARSAAMGFGSAVHYALEHVYKNMSDDADKNFPDEKVLFDHFKKGMFIYRSHFTQKEFDDYSAAGIDHLKAYYQANVHRWSKVAIVEYAVHNAQYQGIPLTGKIDKIEFDGSTITVFDYKTGKPENGIKKLKGISEKDPNGGDYWRQMVFYKLLLDSDPGARRKGWDMIRGKMDFVQRAENNQYVDADYIVPTPDDLQFVKDKVVFMYESLKEHRFEPGCGNKDCQWCNFVKDKYNSASLNLAEVAD